ncbi:YtxH domain-containing protein [Fredinandcohnia quinoae]|uniref:YtxH domain-containing protein n=1 Tax=Fredinandcohnia quinoae TaxID=2918902 RepID=A0AAW5E2N4_9BACI|nr:YtxH domain-containing protein [Fredinandcohnia sp. SECRCQ15]MCH1624246.1 YtxH domain-containing protein [Fredinandcohnia sp. SECRCQ15]
MSNRNKMVESMLIGAVIGAAVSLFDKETRETFVHNSKRVGQKTVDVLKHPGVYTNRLKEQFNTIRTTVEQVTEDVRFVTGKVNELTETTPQIIDILKDTKDALSHKSEVGREDNIER